MPKSVIAFAGRLQSGKTELAKICEEFGYKRLSVATPLKRFIAELLSCTIEDVNRLKTVNKAYIFDDEDQEYIAYVTQIPIDIIKEKVANKTFANTREIMWSSIEQPKNVFEGNTTIGCIITNARLTKSLCSKMASMAHNGYAAAIKPVHTSADGDTIFYLAKGDIDVNPDALGDLGAYVMAKAIGEGVKNAVSAYGFKAMCDL